MPQIPRFEEIDYQQTPLGDLILRKRTVLSLENKEIYEIILGNSFLMSSLFTVVEQELSYLGIAAVEKAFPGEKLDIVVGGVLTSQPSLQAAAQLIAEASGALQLTVAPLLDRAEPEDVR